MFTATATCRTVKLSGKTSPFICRVGHRGMHMTAETRRHIRLENLPRTTLPADIERALRRERLIGVEDVQLQLFRFLPTRRAYITLSHPDILQVNIARLRKVTIGGHTITAVPCLEPPKIENLRGAKGRKAALERGSLPSLTSSSAMSNGRQVCAWGFPPKASAKCVKDFLEHSKIDTLGAKPEIYKVNIQADEFSLYSRYLIRTPSISDSYHVARRIHRTLFQPDTFGTKFQVQAHVVR